MLSNLILNTASIPIRHLVYPRLSAFSHSVWTSEQTKSPRDEARRRETCTVHVYAVCVYVCVRVCIYMCFTHIWNSQDRDRRDWGIEVAFVSCVGTGLGTAGIGGLVHCYVPRVYQSAWHIGDVEWLAVKKAKGVYERNRNSPYSPSCPRIIVQRGSPLTDY